MNYESKYKASGIITRNPTVLPRYSNKHDLTKGSKSSLLMNKNYTPRSPLLNKTSSLGSIVSGSQLFRGILRTTVPFNGLSDTKSVVKPSVKAIKERVNENDLLMVINEFMRGNSQNRDGIESRRSFKMDKTNKYNIFQRKRDISISSKSDNDSKCSGLAKLIRKKSMESQINRLMLRKINILKYREKVFRAASKLSSEMPYYPYWSYQDCNFKYLAITKLNVGGQIFEIFNETLANLIHTKLVRCVKSHTSSGIPYFDRDYVCFNAILNFYRTGRLHLPPNVCHAFFEEELEFWGINETFMEPCCFSEYEVFKTASSTLKKYGEDLDKNKYFDNLEQTYLLNFRKKLYNIMTTGTGSILSRYVSTICAFFILSSILAMIISSTPFGRIDLNETISIYYKPGETVSDFLSRSKVAYTVQNWELIISGFFLAELFCLYFLCPTRLELFSDTLNWIDLLATMTTLLSYIFTKPSSTGNFEGYMLLLKLPRIFRLFKLTPSLRSGVDSFSLTLRACANELKLIFILLIVMTTIFGTLIFAVEMINTNDIEGKNSGFTNVYMGMWWAMVTMTSVGYGEVVPISTVGYLFGTFTIIIGVIICQLPVPIVLKKFLIYNSQSRARLHHKFSVRCVDPESKTIDKVKKTFKRNESKNKFHKIFGKLY